MHRHQDCARTHDDIGRPIEPSLMRTMPEITQVSMTTTREVWWTQFLYVEIKPDSDFHLHAMQP